MPLNDHAFSQFRELYLPTSLSLELKEEERIAAEEEQQRLALDERKKELSDKVRQAALDSKVRSWPPRPLGAALQIFSREAVEAHAEHIDSTSTGEDDKRRVVALFKTLYERGEYRHFGRPGEAWREKLEQLEKHFPLFSDVIAYLRNAMAIAELGDGIPVLLPMLLVGSPGVGKTYFAGHLARFLGTSVTTLQANTMQSNATLSGSASFWSNAVPGRIFKSLVYEDYANPVIVLDEIEKIGVGLQYDPVASLYQLLEPKSAKEFCDLCFDWLPLDASRVVYICTANSVVPMQEPVLSRLKVFHIPDPTEEQSAQVIHHIFREIKNELPMALWSMRMCEEVVASLLLCSPRRVRNVLRDAVGNAVLRGRRNIVLREDLLDVEQSVFKVPRIGFLP